jgi:hypothetical protein
MCNALLTLSLCTPLQKEHAVTASTPRPNITEHEVRDFWGGSPSKREVRIVELPGSTALQLPLRSFLPNPDAAGGTLCYQLAETRTENVAWQFHHVSMKPFGWSIREIGGGISPRAPTPIAVRPGDNQRALWFLSKHPEWMHLSLLTPDGGKEGSITFPKIVGAAFSGNGQVLALARSDGMIYVGKVNEKIKQGRYDACSSYLRDCQDFDLKLGKGGELHSCDFTLDFLGNNVFFIANCRAVHVQNPGDPDQRISLLSQRARGWLKRNSSGKLALQSCANGPPEDWALSVTCFDPTRGKPAAVVPPAPLRRVTGQKGTPTSAQPTSTPGALGSTVCGIFTGLSIGHVQMAADAQRGMSIVPKIKPPGAADQTAAKAPAALNGLCALDDQTVVDWHFGEVRALDLQACPEDGRILGNPLAQWSPAKDRRVLAVQDVNGTHLYIYVAPAIQPAAQA